MQNTVCQQASNLPIVRAKLVEIFKREVLACASVDVIIFLLRQSAVAQGAVAGQVGSNHTPLFLKRGGVRGCEEQTEVCVKHCLRNVKSLPFGKREALALRVWM